MTRDELKEVAKHVSKVGGFKETTIGFKAVESLLRMGNYKPDKSLPTFFTVSYYYWRRFFTFRKNILRKLVLKSETL